jgi:hypothetical protein
MHHLPLALFKQRVKDHIHRFVCVHAGASHIFVLPVHMVHGFRHHILHPVGYGVPGGVTHGQG